MALSASRKGSKLRFAESVSETVIQNGGFEQPEENNVTEINVAPVSEAGTDADQLKNIDDQNTIEADCCNRVLAEPAHSVDELSIADVVKDGKHGREFDAERNRIEVADRNTDPDQGVQEGPIPNVTVATKETEATVDQNPQPIVMNRNTLVAHQENEMKELPAKEAAFVSLMHNKRGTQKSAYFERDVYDYIQDKADTYGIKFSNVMNLLLKEAIQNRES